LNCEKVAAKFNKNISKLPTNFLSISLQTLSFLHHRSMAVPKATTIKEAIKRFEDKAECNALESKEVQLQFQWPPIEKMDPQLGTLVKCE
jgi:hypothetical protein